MSVCLCSQSSCDCQMTVTCPRASAIGATALWNPRDASKLRRNWEPSVFGPLQLLELDCRFFLAGQRGQPINYPQSIGILNGEAKRASQGRDYCGIFDMILPSVLWRCWLGCRKGIRPVKNRVVGCWHGHLHGARCRLAYGPADATATHCLLLQ